MYLEILIIAFLIGANAIFAMAEFAVILARKYLWIVGHGAETGVQRRRWNCPTRPQPLFVHRPSGNHPGGHTRFPI